MPANSLRKILKAFPSSSRREHTCCLSTAVSTARRQEQTWKLCIREDWNTASAGRAEYFNKEDAENIYAAVQASATVPYVSEPVTIGNSRYLDGGLENKIPLEYALNQGHEKIVLVRTRDRDYRKHVRAPLRITRVEYRRYPNLKRDLEEEAARYNVLIDRMTALEQQGQIFMIAPSKPIDIKRFEGNVEALADIYYLGYEDAGNCLDALKEYLEK